NVNQRTGSDAPKISAQPRRRFYKRDTAKRPQNYLISLTTSLAAGKRVSEFVEQDDQEKTQILGRGPDRILITLRESGDLKRGDQKPGKMEIDLDPRQREIIEASLSTDLQTR